MEENCRAKDVTPLVHHKTKYQDLSENVISGQQ